MRNRWEPMICLLCELVWCDAIMERALVCMSGMQLQEGWRGLGNCSCGDMCQGWANSG